ncbi:MAG: hypothetical protein ACE5HK_00430 [Candidatus Methylomirabilales bacterium]
MQRAHFADGNVKTLGTIDRGRSRRKLRGQFSLPVWTLFLLSLSLLTASAAAEEIPHEALVGQTGAAVKRLLAKHTIHRTVSGIRVPGSPPLFAFLLDHPDFAAALARAAGVSRYKIRREGDGRYFGDDGRGATGVFERVAVLDGRRVFLAQGQYKARLFGRIRADMAIIVTFRQAEDTAGNPSTENSLTGYVRIRHALLHPLLKLFGPLVDKAVDRKVRRFYRKARALLERLTTEGETLLALLPAEAWIEERQRLKALLAEQKGPNSVPPEIEVSVPWVGVHSRRVNLDVPQ